MVPSEYLTKCKFVNLLFNFFHSILKYSFFFHNFSRPSYHCKCSYFFQTGFVETLCPQFTPGLVLTSPSVQTQRTPQATFIDPIEHEGLRAQVKDLTEKLETMRSEKEHFCDYVAQLFSFVYSRLLFDFSEA